ncbi:MAG: CusA/CzcA family heavy metal efflux RND transporter [Myxococcales bacterium]|nr:CusA/CzcA family heavy metal efflux RND transporter [Myxococcales bacterium]
MLNALVAFSIRRRFVILAFTAVFVALGLRAFSRLPIDAVPDLTNVQVQVLTSAPSLAPLDVERLVTVPVEQALTGMPRVQEIRSLSRFGTSAVTVVFDDDTDPFFARQLVSERLPRMRDNVPSAYGTPELGPMTTGLGEIYQFELRGTGTSAMELRALLDWTIAPRLRMVPGVVEVNTSGGELKTYEVSVDPDRLVVFGVSLQDLLSALTRNNRSVGGGAILRGPEGLLVRGDALVQSTQEMGRILVAHRKGIPVTVDQLGTVRLAPMLRQGATTRDARGEIVAGTAMMLQGENSRVVARAVAAEVARINQTLPAGIRLEAFYDRTALVNQTIRTVARNLIEGGLLVVALLFIMLRNLRAGLIAAAMIPLSMLAAFIGMRQMGLSGNLMSLGAIDFGLVVDGGIILLENAVLHLSEATQRLGRSLTRAERDEIVQQAAVEVRSATLFGELIIALVYVPILALEGVEGKLFAPMALTVLFALAGAFVLSLTFVPALAALLLGRHEHDKPSPVVEAARKLYAPALTRTLDHPVRVGGVAAAALVVGVFVARGLGTEFVPTLDEGALVIEVNRLPSTSLEESIRQGLLIEAALATFPEVQTVVTKTGRPEIANDPMGVEQSDVFVMLRPRDEWPRARSREDLVTEVEAALREAAPGAAMGFSQPIEMRTNELISGVRSDFAVKLYGEDLSVLGRFGAQIGRLLSGLEGAADVRVDRVAGLPALEVTVDREAIARRGVDADDVMAAVQIVGGTTVGFVLEGRRRFALRVRLAPEARNDLDALRRLPIRTPGGGFALLEELASVEITDEPLLVNREGNQRRLVVQANVRGRDLGGFADEAQAQLAASLSLPPGYHIELGGQFDNLRRAKARLAIVVPLALVLIFGLLYATFGAVRPAALIFINVPFAAVGGIFALALVGLPFSISAGVGFIALFGVAVLNGLVLVSQIRHQSDTGHDPHTAAREGALRRLRPVLTTALVASLGFLPMAVASGAGAEVQRPLATVVIGGLVTSTLLTLLVLPTLHVRFGAARRRPEGAAGGA